MNFKKIIILFCITLQSMFALTSSELKILNKIIDEGIVINKHMNSKRKNIEVILFKAYKNDYSSYALLRVVNNSNQKIYVNDIIKEGKVVDNKLDPKESTYVIVEEKETYKKLSTIKKDLLIEENIKEYKYENIIPILNTLNGVFFLEKNKITKISKSEIEEHFKNVEVFDYYNFIKLNIQNTLYEGYYFNGYENMKNKKVFPRTYYFITDGMTGDLVYLYLSNEKISFEDFKIRIDKLTINKNEKPKKRIEKEKEDFMNGFF